MSFFNKKGFAEPMNQPGVLMSRYHSARHNLLLVIVFTLINIFLLAINSGVYFLFSAFIPYILVYFGMLFCGMRPAEFYQEFYPGMQFVDRSFLVVCCIFAFMILAVYLFCWIFSKKPRVGWLIFALVIFLIDTVFMLIMQGFSSSIVDIIFHVWVIISLIMGIVSCFKLKKIEAESSQIPVTEDGAAEYQEIQSNTEYEPAQEDHSDDASEQLQDKL